jgi:meiotic recombination protein REC8
MSLAMPWNVSASQRFSTLQHLRPSRAGSISSALPPHGRLTSASPLLGRGATLPDRLSRQGSLALGPAGAPTSSVGGVDFDLGGYGIDADVSMHDADAPMNTQDRFELLGPAANVDTQEAGTSQWMRAVLDTESGNFLDFVEAEIERRKDDGGDVIEFETLLPPEMNTAVVAAQGLLHCLALATKGLLSVKQEEDFGDIVLGLMGREEGSFVGK